MRLPMDDTKNDLMTLQYHGVISWHRYIDMDNSQNRKKIAK